jgi:magnesium transporter
VRHAAQGFYGCGEHWMLIALAVAVALKDRHVRLADRINAPVHPATDWVRSGQRASAPFVATLVDVTGLVIYFTVASMILRGTLL